ncbi:MAG: response regulator [Actinomycetota bacterium]|nr:response regulator [Actinomycetota bacterium]
MSLADTSPENTRTVLVVDDDPDIRYMLRLKLEVAGYTVVSEASNGAEAAWEAENHHPDFVILDYAMPVMRGDQAATLIRGVSPDSRIIAFSAFTSGDANWADITLPKEDVSRLLDVLEEFS